MKSGFFVIIILLVGFIGCNDNPTVPDQDSSTITSLSGNFVDWDKGNTHRILFLGAPDIWNSDKIYASSSIASSGYFSLKNLDTPTSAWLMNPAYPQWATGEDMHIQQNIVTCSDSAAKVVYGNLIIVRDTSNRRVAEVYRQNFSHNYYLEEHLRKSGDCMSEYIFSDRDVEVSGQIKYVYLNRSLSTEYRMTQNYSLKFKKGWNRRVQHIVSYDIEYESANRIVTAEDNYNNYEPGDAKWYFYYYNIN